MWWLFPAALAAMPPNVDLDDLDPWESAAEQILDLPPGCWEWVGQASWDWNMGRFGSSRGDAAFAGRITDGLWGEVALQPLGELRRERREADESRIYVDEARFTPLVGRLSGARITVAGDEDAQPIEDNAEAVNVLRQALDRIGGDAFTSYATWDEDRGGVILHRAIPLAKGRSEEIDVDIFFPGGGVAPSLLDVTFPASFKTGKLPRWTVRNAEVHIQGLVRGTSVFPSSEAFRFDFGFLGFRFSGAQSIAYKRVTRCALPAPTPPEPDSDDVTGG